MRPRSALGWLIGVVTAGLAVGVGELVAAFVRPESSPVIAVARRIVSLTPSSAERATTSSVGTADKPLLIGAILLLLAVLGAIVGDAALRSLRNGLIGVAVVGAFAAWCALTAPGGRAEDMAPALVGIVVAGLGLVLLVRAARHDRPPPRRPDERAAAGPPDRRAVLGGIGLAAAAAAGAGIGGRMLQHNRFDVSAERAEVRLPGGSKDTAVPTGADLGKSPLPWRTPNAQFYRIDTALTVPQVPASSWQLRIHGLVDTPITLNYQDLLSRPMIERWITLCCVSNEVGGNLIGNALWRGVRLADVLREAGLQDGADELLMTSVDGMTIGAPTQVVMDGRDALLAVGMNGQPLPVEHGFPVRVVVPGLYGYVSACKWVSDIEATTFDRRSAFWVAKGWAKAPHHRARVPHRSPERQRGAHRRADGDDRRRRLGPARRRLQGRGQDQRRAVADGAAGVGPLDRHVAAVGARHGRRRRAGQYTITVRATDARGHVQVADAPAALPGRGHGPGLGRGTGGRVAPHAAAPGVCAGHVS